MPASTARDLFSEKPLPATRVLWQLFIGGKVRSLPLISPNAIKVINVIVTMARKNVAIFFGD